MDTLYDLLGALPHDDAEDLRAAFRRAVKGTHPDLRPGDPDAALKFRQIVRANEILADPEQRAAYDHLMVLARVEQRSASKYRIAARIHSLASSVLVLAGASIVTVGSYLLLMHMSTALVAPATNPELAMRLSPDIAAVSQSASRYPTEASSVHAKGESPGAPAETIAPVAVTSPIIATPVTTAAVLPPKVMSPTNVESIPPLKVAATSNPAPNDAISFRARGISAYRNGDLDRAVAELDQAIQLDPNFPASYIDRGIIYYRLRKFDRAFADIAQAKRIQKESQSKSLPAMARKPRVEPTGIAGPTSLRPPRRTAGKTPSPERWFASVVLH